MREITKTVSIPVGGKPMDFRLKKLDAFSGVSLLRMLSRIPDSGASVLTSFFSSLTDEDLCALMTTCLEHIEVLLPAGYHPVMMKGEWSWPELEYEVGACLNLCIEEVSWTLEGFFGERGAASRSGTPGS